MHPLFSFILGKFHYTHTMKPAIHSRQSIKSPNYIEPESWRRRWSSDGALSKEPTCQCWDSREILSSASWWSYLFISGLQGWNNRKGIETDLRPYWKVCGELSVDRKGLLLHGKCIVVCKALREHSLEKIHQGHQEILICRIQAKISVWWPGISHDVENMVRECPICAWEFRPCAKNPWSQQTFQIIPSKMLAPTCSS